MGSNTQGLIFNRHTDNYWFTAQDVIAPSNTKNLRLRSRDTYSRIDINDNNFNESTDSTVSANANTYNKNIVMATDNIVITGPSNETYNPSSTGNNTIGFKEFVFNSKRAIQLPRGTTTDRPRYDNTKNIDVDGRAGLMRFNTDLSVFEGHNGAAWNVLGGLIDVDKDTFITAEDRTGGAPNNSNILRFFTGGAQGSGYAPQEKMRIMNNSTEDGGRIRMGHDLSGAINSFTIEFDPTNGDIDTSGVITASGGVFFGDKSGVSKRGGKNLCRYIRRIQINY